MSMTQAERDVLDAARDAVTIEQHGTITVADISKNHERVGALVRAVAKLKQAGADYWRER